MVRPVALDHIVLRTPDVETTLAWYVELLGLDPVRVEEWRAGDVPFPSARVNESTIIDFVEAAGDPAADGSHLDHLCLVVEGDLGEVLADERTEVLSDEVELFGARGLGRSVYVRDPGGATVELRRY